MTLLVLMYHKASAGRHGNSAEMLDAHFALIARSHHCVLPGEPLDDRVPNVCLTFDDGYFDFYAVVFPLLLRHGLRAVLAVPISAISERSDVAMTARLQACSQRLQDCDALGTYCTWAELAEMAESGSVSIASHGFTHSRLDRSDVDLHTEIVVPQTVLAARTGQAIDSFVLPYGRFNADTIACVKAHYRYVFRIGSADNDGWLGQIIYRIDADEMGGPDELFSPRRLVGYRLRRHWNAMRSR